MVRASGKLNGIARPFEFEIDETAKNISIKLCERM